MITKYRIITLRNSVLVTIKRSNRKTLGLEVKPTGEVLARVPVQLSDCDIKKFLDSHKKWIIEKQASVKARENGGSQSPFPVYDELSQREREEIKNKIVKRVRDYSSKMKVSYNRVTVRNQKTRWGSCSSKGNLNFNYRLFYLPEELLDYVVVHELAHRRHMNHSKDFWQEVERYFPDYKTCRKQLKEVGIENG